MIIGPKYKIARRLGAPIFEKTQTPKYSLHLERRGKKQGFAKSKTEYGVQMNEKQKARFVYAISEKRLANYVKEAIAQKGGNATNLIFGFLESRLDNVMYRLGYSSTRLGARQMVSHGHIMVNGRRLSVPSMQVSMGDVISVRPESLAKPLFAGLDERIKNVTVPSWIKSDTTKKTAEIQGKPVLVPTENMFDLNTVIEFYSR